MANARQTTGLSRSVSLLTVAALLPIILFAVINAGVTLRHEQAAIERDAVDRAHRLMDLVDRELQADVDLIETLATLPLFDGTVDLDQFREMMERAQKEHPLWGAVILSEPDGTRISGVGLLGTGLGPVVEAPSHARVVATGAPAVGTVRLGAAGRPGVPVRAPVIRDGKLKYVLSVVIRPDAIRDLLLESNVPNDWIATVGDSDGLVVARKAGAAAFIGKPLSEPARAARLRGGEGIYEGETLEGVRTVSAYRVSPVTGWSVHIGVPYDVYREPFLRSLWFTAGGAVITILLASAFTLLLIRELRLRRKAAHAFEQAQRMESLGRLTGGVAHDFNNLLTVILGNVSLLEENPDGDIAVRRLAAVRRAAERGANLTAQLLAFTRGGASETRVVDLNERVRAAMPLLRETVRGDIAIELQLAPKLPPVAVDPIQLDLALLNLAANARDAMSRGGVLTIKTALAMADAGGGPMVALSLTDTGVGMPAEIAAHVFEPFFTTKEPGKGTGLGLTQVYGFARQAGGMADIASVVGQGTTITLRLPVSAAAVDATAEAEHRRPAMAAAEVLVVDDDHDVRGVMTDYLRTSGHRVREAENAEAALALLERERFGAVISDIMMPGRMDGLDLARTIRRRWPHLPVLLVSGFSSAAEDAAREGLTVLRKPYPPEALSKALADAIGQ